MFGAVVFTRGHWHLFYQTFSPCVVHLTIGIVIAKLLEWLGHSCLIRPGRLGTHGAIGTIVYPEGRAP
jgi:hypothetical protein